MKESNQTKKRKTNKKQNEHNSEKQIKNANEKNLQKDYNQKQKEKLEKNEAIDPDEKKKKQVKTGKRSKDKKEATKKLKKGAKQSKHSKKQVIKNEKEIPPKQPWIYLMILRFLREHFLLVGAIAIVFAFLLSLKLAVSCLDEMNKNFLPKITDLVRFGVQIENGTTNDLVFGLYGNDCPLTVKNFIMLSKHDKGYGYNGTEFFAVVKGLLMVGGDVVSNDGSSGRSALDEPFEGENLKIPHILQGTLGMIALKENDDSKKTSQFYVTLGDCSVLNGKTVVFGHLIQGIDHLREIENIPVQGNKRPQQSVTIVSTSHEIVDSK